MADSANMWVKLMGTGQAVDLRVDLTRTTVSQVKQQIHEDKAGIPVEYIQIHHPSRGPEPLGDDKTFAELGIPLESTLFLVVANVEVVYSYPKKSGTVWVSEESTIAAVLSEIIKDVGGSRNLQLKREGKVLEEGKLITEDDREGVLGHQRITIKVDVEDRE